MDELDGLSCVITGASRGLGRILAITFWEAGADLFLTARSRPALDALASSLPPRVGQRVGVISADMADPESPARIVEECRRVLSSLDVLVNNAAIQGPVGLAWENDWQEWQRTIQVNLLAPTALCRLCVPWMASARRGKIINLSGGGATAARMRFSAYGAAKSALVRFSETLAEETRNLGIDVNSVAPGAMATGMLEAVLALGPEAAGEEEYRRAKDAYDRGEGEMDRAVALCVFLASAASDGITGKLISAMWDPWEELSSHAEDLRNSDIYTLRRIVPKDRGFAWGERHGK